MMKQKTKWAVQSKLGNSTDIEKIVACLEQQHIPYEMIEVIPFSDDPPALVEDQENVIFYGSTTLIKNVYAAQKWKPGVWFNPNSYEFENVLKGYGKENLLNGDSEVITVKELLSRDYPFDEILFVRPAADMKEFTGAAMEFQEIKKWDGFKSSKGPFSVETKVQVATPKNIEAEYRTVVVDKQVITSSQYRRNNRFNCRDEVPQSIIDYASEMAQLYQPSDVFVLDVCELTNRTLKIVETNTFNASGFYWADYYKIIQEVTRFAETCS